MKKVLAYLLACFLCLSFVACGSAETEDSTATNSSVTVDSSVDQESATPQESEAPQESEVPQESETSQEPTEEKIEWTREMLVDDTVNFPFFTKKITFELGSEEGLDYLYSKYHMEDGAKEPTNQISLTLGEQVLEVLTENNLYAGDTPVVKQYDMKDHWDNRGLASNEFFSKDRYDNVILYYYPESKLVVGIYEVGLNEPPGSSPESFAKKYRSVVTETPIFPEGEEFLKGIAYAETEVNGKKYGAGIVGVPDDQETFDKLCAEMFAE